MTEPIKTIRVRIPCYVTATGSWHASGTSQNGDGTNSWTCAEEACDELDMNDIHHLVWIEAALPLPDPATFQGEVKT